MISSVNVNNRSVVHASSTGVCPAFPDPCKTPTPGGPVPIPYPNIAMSSDTDGTSSVKIDGASAMVKGANIRMSTGDEAGSLLGVVSNKIKGKAEFTMYSFDVKLEGKNACRLGDAMFQNCGSSPMNASGPFHGQGMKPGMATDDDGKSEACKKAKNTRRKKDRTGDTAWGKSGIIARHRAPIVEVVSSIGLKVLFRKTKAVCGPWIEKNYQPKPHSITKGTTITDSVPPDRWLAKYTRLRAEAEAVGKLPGFIENMGFKKMHHYENSVPPGFFAGRPAPGEGFIGIVGSTIKGEKGRPMLANRPIGSFAHNSYLRKYVTGDYDLYDVLVDRSPQCRRALQDGATFARFQREANKKMKWDGIQHGPQAQWNAKETGEGNFSIPDKLTKWLNKPSGTKSPTFTIPGRDPAKVVDDTLTVVNARGASSLENADETKDWLICCGCKKPAPGRD